MVGVVVVDLRAWNAVEADPALLQVQDVIRAFEFEFCFYFFSVICCLNLSISPGPCDDLEVSIDRQASFLP